MEIPAWLVIATAVLVFLLTTDRALSLLARRVGGGLGWFVRRTVGQELEEGQLVSPEQLHALAVKIDTLTAEVRVVKGHEVKIMELENELGNGLNDRIDKLDSRIGGLEERQGVMDGKLDVIVRILRAE